MFWKKLAYLLVSITILLFLLGANGWNKHQDTRHIPVSSLTAEQKEVAQYLIESEWQLGRLSLEERFDRLSEFYIDAPRFPLSSEQRNFVQKMLPILGNTVDPVSDSWGQLTFERAWTKQLIEGYSLLQKMAAGQASEQEIALMRQRGIEPMETRPPYQNREEAESLFDFYAFDNNSQGGTICVLHRFGDAKANTCLVTQQGKWYIAYRKIFPWASPPPTELQK